MAGVDLQDRQASAAHELDLTIIGGGPAGSLTAALVLRQHPEKRVMVLERETFPRHHVGESSIPSWGPILERAGVLGKLEAAGLMRKVGTLFQWGNSDAESWTIDFRDEGTGGARPGSYQVDRARFDQLLLDHARSVGARVYEGAAFTGLEPLEEGGYRIKWRGEGARTATTRYLVDASGQARALARHLGLKAIPFDDMNNFAIYGYWRGSKIAEFAGPPVHEHERWTYIATCPDGWLWHIPTHPDLVSVGLVTESSSVPAGGRSALEAIYRRNVAECPAVAELLSDAELVCHPLENRRLLVIRDWAYHLDRVCGPDFFLAGDAAAFVDPILSSGMLIAANGASLAANALHTLWTDPDVDVPLLLESYQAAYDDMAGSYHRLAAIWYSRNFKSQTWHWEAKRQRLRTGGHPAAETDAESFLQLCLGSFANPVEGAFAERGMRVDLARPDAQIYTAHLFDGQARVGNVRGDELSEAELRSRIASEAAARWRALLDRRARLKGVERRLRESYFSDSTMHEWKRVRYIELKAEGCRDSFDRVVFPITKELPSGVFPLLDGQRTIREALRALCAVHPVGSSTYTTTLELAQQQILQLDMRRWLAFEGEAPSAGPAGFPPGLAEAIAAAAPSAELSIDLLGTSLSVLLRRQGSREGAVLVPRKLASRQRTWRQVGSAGVSYRGELRNIAPLLRSVMEWLVELERREPGRMERWWSQEAPLLAGETRSLAGWAS